MELNPKAMGFVAQALEHHIGWYEEQLRRAGLSEDDRSELTNDMYYEQALIDAIRQELGPAGRR